jgi:hypothetical protein
VRIDEARNRRVLPQVHDGGASRHRAIARADALDALAVQDNHAVANGLAETVAMVAKRRATSLG